MNWWQRLGTWLGIQQPELDSRAMLAFLDEVATRNEVESRTIEREIERLNNMRRCHVESRSAHSDSWELQIIENEVVRLETRVEQLKERHKIHQRGIDEALSLFDYICSNMAQTRLQELSSTAKSVRGLASTREELDSVENTRPRLPAHSQPTNRAGRLRESARIAIVTALPKEFAAVEALLHEPVAWQAMGVGAGRRYSLGEIPSGSASHAVVLGMCNDIGNNNAAIRATKLLTHFPSIRHLILCGIAGGMPRLTDASRHVRLGDVVVSDRNGITQYDNVKDASDGGIVFRSPPRPPSAELLEAVNFLEAQRLRGVRPWERFLGVGAQLDSCNRPSDDLDAKGDPIAHPADQGRQVGVPRVFRGPIASANRLLKDPGVRDEIAERFGVLAFEMEASGLADAAWDSDCASFLVVRGICDYCDPAKGDLWQGYAAVAAAAYVRALIESLPSER